MDVTRRTDATQSRPYLENSRESHEAALIFYGYAGRVAEHGVRPYLWIAEPKTD